MLRTVPVGIICPGAPLSYLVVCVGSLIASALRATSPVAWGVVLARVGWPGAWRWVSSGWDHAEPRWRVASTRRLVIHRTCITIRVANTRRNPIASRQAPSPDAAPAAGAARHSSDSALIKYPSPYTVYTYREHRRDPHAPTDTPTPPMTPPTRPYAHTSARPHPTLVSDSVPHTLNICARPRGG